MPAGSGHGGRTRRRSRDMTVPFPPPRLAPFLGPPVLLLCLFFYVGLCRGAGHVGEEGKAVAAGKCMATERAALLAVRADIAGADHWLPSWETDHYYDCCRWKGVGCDDKTGHVVSLDLSYPSTDGYPYFRSPAPSKVNPSLANLTGLMSLNLSHINFGGTPIPSFLGSLVNLEYLNLSWARFAGVVPPHLGNLRNLRSLDLSGFYRVKVRNLRWLSHLSRLHYLDMSGVDLSAANDWLHVINMLPSLAVLRLRGCWLPNLPTSLPHVNFTSLSTLDLSSNYFNSTFPYWLFNVTNLVSLNLDENPFLHGRIPEGFESMKHLEALYLWGGSFEGWVPESLWKLENLKSLSLSGSNLLIGMPKHMGESKNLQKLALAGVVDRLPESLGNISSLQLLILSDVISELPESLGNLSNLKDLWLYNNNFNGGIPESLGNLSRLESLRLVGNSFSGRTPKTIWDLQKLRHLELSGSNLLVGMPKHMGNSKNLQDLQLDGVAGGLPESLGNISSLQHLRLSNMISELPQSLGSLYHLESLELYFSKISGRIPESLGNLVNLKELSLYYNDIEGGTGGASLRSFGDLCNLTSIEMSGNHFRGGAEVTDLVEGLSQCIGGSALEGMSLTDNTGLGGHLPDGVGQLHSLIDLDLSGNNISGSIPSTIGKLSLLNFLDISSNSFVDVLTEAHFANMSKLSSVDMSHNALSLNIPGDWIPPCQLSSFRMSSCQVGPEFPKWLATQNHLYKVDLSDNRIHDNLPDDLLNSFSFQASDELSNPFPFQKPILNVSHNQMKGALPISLVSRPFAILDLSFNHFESSQLPLHLGSTLIYLDLSNNLISGPLFITTGDGDISLKYLSFSHNNLSGSIPLSICQVNSLQLLDLSNNYLSGEIPECLQNTSLLVIKFSKNELSGPIPSSIGMLQQLKLLHLDQNHLIGEIPSSLKHLVQLVTLDLGKNNLSGEIPTWLGESLPSLQILRLRSNKLHGSIPSSLSQLQSLQILDLACNRLSGTILLSFHNLSAMVKVEKSTENITHSFFTAPAPPMSPVSFEDSVNIVPKGTELEYTKTLLLVTIIDLSNNNLSGLIPEEIISLHGLRFLNLSRNHLQGKIPENISTIHLLESLDLSFNQLSGSIPSSMSTLNFLAYFDVSYNNLWGRIPLGGQLGLFKDAYIGNIYLCGIPLPRLCPGDATSRDPTSQASESQGKGEQYIVWLYIGMGPGFVTGFWVFLGVLLLVRKSNKIAYFYFIDRVADQLYVFIVVNYARIKLKITSWLQKSSTNGLTN